MTRSDALDYIARIVTGVNDPTAQVWAEEALQQGFIDWQKARDWEYLLKDTSLPVTVTASAGAGPHTSISSLSVEANGLNIGTICHIGGSDLAVTSLSYTAAGDVVVVIFGENYEGPVTSFTYDADIPIRADVADYHLPHDFYSPAIPRLLTNPKMLYYMRNSFWYRGNPDTAVSGATDFYTMFNAKSPSADPIKKFRLRRAPSQADTLRFEYYREFDPAADPVDMPSSELYSFLNYCRGIVLEIKRAQDDPGGYIKRQNDRLEQAAQADNNPAEDEDIGLYSQMDVYGMNSPRQLWRNGDFTEY